MAEATYAPSNLEADRREGITVAADDVHVKYRVHQGQRPTLRRFIANRFRPQPYRAVHALRGVSLTAHAGEAIGVIGRNGSGKSTLLKTIAGLLPVSQGSVHVRSMPVLLGVGTTLQQELSGHRNIYLGGTALGLTRSEIDERFDEIVEFAGLEEFIDLPLRAYSSGMTARLHFAIATTVRPDILLIDETLAVGDAEFRRKSERRIRELLEHAGTVFIVSHSLGMIAELSSRVLWLDRGRVRAEGSPQDVIDAYTDEVDEAEDG